VDRRDARAVTPIALTIAGSDSGGGAGIQADLKTFAALGVYAATAITAVTAQNTLGVRAIHLVPVEIVAGQVLAVTADFKVAAIKIGMLGSTGIVEAVARVATHPRGSPKRFIVFDPVMFASSGDKLSGDGFVEAIRVRLLPIVDCLTPNLAEAAALLGEPPARDEAEMIRQGRALRELGPRAVLMKGGHLDGDAVDLLVTADAIDRFAAPRIDSRNLHGTGCMLSSAIAARVILGASLREAVERAKDFVRAAIERGRHVKLGGGAGPLLPLPLRAGLGASVNIEEAG
jgi:hydroxymethylpyrimidine/phosphomethylpyrimidine kinase